MTNPLHHTIRDYLPSRILLAKQQVERINLEYKLLTARIEEARRENPESLARAEVDYYTWHKRLVEDVTRDETRLKEDGFEQSDTAMWQDNTPTRKLTRVTILEQDIPYLLTGDIDFTPDLSDGVENVTRVWVWRKAVQS